MNVKAGATAALHSAWISALGLGAGLITNAATSGANTPQEYGQYIAHNWFGFAVANLILPLIRGGMAAKKGDPAP